MKTTRPSLRYLSLSLALLPVLFLTACKTKAAKDSGYLGATSGQMSEQRGRFPFQRVWIKPGINKNAFNDDKKNRFKVIEQPVSRTLVLDLAIVELIPSKAVLNAIAIVAPPEVAIPVSVAAGKASVAIEGRVRDAVTGETLMMFADGEEPAHRIIDLKSVTWWSQGRGSIDLWARQMVKLANTHPDEKVKDEAFFKLRPW